jgi:hypothetical protein
LSILESTEASLYFGAIKSHQSLNILFEKGEIQGFESFNSFDCFEPKYDLAINGTAIKLFF